MKLWWKVLTAFAFLGTADVKRIEHHEKQMTSLQIANRSAPRSIRYDIILRSYRKRPPDRRYGRDVDDAILLRGIRSNLYEKFLKLAGTLAPYYVVKPRRRGDPYTYILRKAQVSSYWRKMLNKMQSRHLSYRRSVIRWPEVRHWIYRKRKLQWEDYDRNYNWENGGKEYEVPGKEPRKLSKWEKWAENWQKHALKFLFVFSAISMVLCCCVAFCKKFCGAVCSIIMKNVKDARDVCLNRDPSYRHARKFADDYGIELDYNQFKEIKQSYESALSSHYGTKVDLSGRNY